MAGQSQRQMQHIVVCVINKMIMYAMHHSVTHSMYVCVGVWVCVCGGGLQVDTFTAVRYSPQWRGLSVSL
jgi:hypothetical protein